MSGTHTHAKLSVATISTELKSHGFRVTKGKVNLLTILGIAQKPLSVSDILTVWKGRTPDQTTLYRGLTDLATANVIKRIDLNTGIAHFEYTPSNPHHHHLVCTDCGIIEDVTFCMIDTLENQVIKKSKSFKSIYSHNLEFFGHCTSCNTT